MLKIFCSTGLLLLCFTGSEFGHVSSEHPAFFSRETSMQVVHIRRASGSTNLF
jgi:hypothetical protein